MPDEPRPVPADQLYRSTDLSAVPFDTTDDLEAFDGLLGQERAEEALELGLGVEGDGYNIFAHGPNAGDKALQVRRILTARAAARPPAFDWCYVNNFDDENKPLHLRLPAGRGARLRQDLDAFAGELQSALAAAFESEEYQARRQALEQQSESEQQEGLEAVQERAQQRALRLVRTPMGFIFAPVKDGDVVAPQELEKLSDDEQQRIQKAVEELQEELQLLLRQDPGRQRQLAQRVRELDREFAELAVRDLIGDVKRRYPDEDVVLAHLDAVQVDVTDNARTLVESGGRAGGQIQAMAQQQREHILERYQVNVLVSSEEGDGAPVVYEDNPNYQNLIGRVEYRSQFGALTTSFGLIRGGALHRANGGYLVLDARKVLMQPYAWEALKRALSSRKLVIESPGQALGLISTSSLEPEPIPLDLKVVLLGERQVYALLEALDPEFPELFKVQADFGATPERTPEQQALYARLVAHLAQRQQLRPLDRGAVARVLEHSARLVGDSRKLSSQTRPIADLLREADHLGRARGDGPTTADDVQGAIRARTHRADRIRDELLEQVLRGTVRIATQGSRIGQINGLAVLQTAELAFGRPSRITARTRLGDGRILDVEREVELGGPLHSKGVMILSGYLKAHYAPETPLSLSASLVFEQSYGAIDGDSASSAELYALLSAIAELPLRQDLAVTGSVNQLGEVQAIGGVNEKIEGFFDLCAARGLTGEQGVLIPGTNLQHLMLDERVVSACRDGRFHVWAVDTVDQGMELLTGLPMGRRDESGAYPDGSVNARVEARLRHLADIRRSLRSNANGPGVEEDGP
jgi:lon-related putative ATP-dependent protease